MLRYEPLALEAGSGLHTDDTVHITVSQKVPIFGKSHFWVFVSVLAILGSDLIALLFTRYCSHWLAGSLAATKPLSYSSREILFLLFPAAYAAADLYPGFGLGAVTTLRRLTHCTCLGFLILILVGYVFDEPRLLPGLKLFLSWLLVLITVPLFRFGVLSVASNFRWWGFPTVIIGDRHAVELTIRTLRSAFSLGYRVVGAIVIDRCAVADIDGIPVLGDITMAPQLRRSGVRAAIIWDSSANVAPVAELQRYFPHVILVRDERLLPVEHLRVRNLGGVVGIEFTCQLFRRTNRALKRTLDIVVSGMLTFVASPVILFSGLAVKAISPGPMFYSQEREGLNGSKFKVTKLRTMYEDADQRLAQILSADPVLERQWKESLKLSQDPRIIPVVGAFLRRFSIDELPQLFAVLRGDMSLVGPRPFPDYHLKVFDPEFRQLRCMVRPGLTGMWQVMVRSAGDTRAQERYDSFYIRNWSLWLDAYILVRTAFAVLTGKGAC